MKLSTLSLLPSALGVALIMGVDPTGLDLMRAALCFAVAIAMCWADDRAG